MSSLSEAEEAREAFARTLQEIRRARNLSKKQLAQRMGYDASYVSHIERLQHPPTADFARRADTALESADALWRLYVAFDEARKGRRGAPENPRPAEPVVVDDGALRVERETATLRYTDGSYHCRIERRLHNTGTEPVMFFRVIVSVDRYPGNPEWSNRYYRMHPLTSTELNFSARIGDPPGDPIDWSVIEDRDSLKEILLNFQNRSQQFPLYPGRTVTIAYEYTVPEAKWGPWFERLISMPTGELVVRLEFPRTVDVTVWGTHRTLTGDSPLRTPVRRTVRGAFAVFEWSATDPPRTSWYRMQWRFRAGPEHGLTLSLREAARS